MLHTLLPYRSTRSASNHAVEKKKAEAGVLSAIEKHSPVPPRHIRGVRLCAMRRVWYEEVGPPNLVGLVSHLALSASKDET